MVGPGIGLAALASLYATGAHAQAKWAKGQVNTTICEWQQLRAHVVRDTVYMDGGSIWWLPGMEDGTFGSTVKDNNPLGIVYTLNFSKPFSTTQNMTSIFGSISKVSSGLAAKNIAPNYFDGAMLGNNEEWFLYGGLLRQTDEFSMPAADNVLAYQQFQYGVERDFTPSFMNDDLPDGMTRYLAYGGAASAPSENKAWYFSGMHSKSWGPIFEPGGNESLTATNVSNTLITLDMKTQLQETWKNQTLQDDIPGRANPELVWVPVGEQGILVALGGVVYPDFVGFLAKSADEAASKETSPGFMSTIDIYDVANDKWYRQPTVGGPGQLTRGCAVVAPAQDASSFNIYYYGGYPGLKPTEGFNDDVWVLSMPSFTWTKITDSKVTGRAGHKCFMPYPDQMMVIGGYTARGGQALTCLRETVRVFNMTTGTWLTEYSPAKWSKYAIPAAVVSKIGGSPTGGATASSPSPSWASTDLAAVFRTKYDTAKIQTFYPYQLAASGNNTNPTVPPPPVEKSGGGTPAFLAPVLGVVLGLMFVTMVVVLILLWRRRRLFRARSGGMSEAGMTEDSNKYRILSWMRGQTNADPKAPTVTTSDDTTSSPGDLESLAAAGARPGQPQSMAEMMNTEIRAPVELMDTSPRPELHDTGLSHVDVLNRYSKLGAAVASDPMHYSSPSSAAAAATPSSASASHTRHDSSELPASPTSPVSAAVRPSPRGYIPSGVSGVSEGERAHLRTISDATAVSDDGPSPLPPTPSQPTPSQPTPGLGASTTGATPFVTAAGTLGGGTREEEGGDYLSARARGTAAGVSPASPGAGSMRRSVFQERAADMEDHDESEGMPSPSPLGGGSRRGPGR